jgi:hypothetical protein
MRTRIALVSLFVSSVLSGCAVLGVPRSAPIHCSQGECTVPVSMQGCTYDVAEELRLRGHPADRVTIRWRMQGTGKFTLAKGIDFRGNGKFRLVSSNEREYVFEFDNRDKNGRHKYDVNAEGCRTHDPFVMN